MAWAAILALNMDKSRFVDKEELQYIRQEILQLRSQASSAQSLLHICQNEIRLLKTHPPTFDTAALKHSPKN
jgi:hypothetical protein